MCRMHEEFIQGDRGIQLEQEPHFWIYRRSHGQSFDRCGAFHHNRSFTYKLGIGSEPPLVVLCLDQWPDFLQFGEFTRNHMHECLQ